MSQKRKKIVLVDEGKIYENYSERIKEIELRITEATQIYKLTIRYRPGLKSLINF